MKYELCCTSLTCFCEDRFSTGQFQQGTFSIEDREYIFPNLTPIYICVAKLLLIV